jgi:ATP phosphoribosyltransferase
LEVWFQRPKDIVRKLLSGDLDLGIVGLDILTEFGQVQIISLLSFLGFVYIYLLYVSMYGLRGRRRFIAGNFFHILKQLPFPINVIVFSGYIAYATCGK